LKGENSETNRAEKENKTGLKKKNELFFFSRLKTLNL